MWGRAKASTACLHFRGTPGKHLGRGVGGVLGSGTSLTGAAGDRSLGEGRGLASGQNFTSQPQLALGTQPVTLPGAAPHPSPIRHRSPSRPYSGRISGRAPPPRTASRRRAAGACPSRVWVS